MIPPFDLDWWNEVASVIGGIVAVGGVAIGAARILRDRRQPKGRASPLGGLIQELRDADAIKSYPLTSPVPLLSDEYVPRTLVAREGGDQAVTEAALLSPKAGNALVIGEPGSGKTALVKHAAAESARHLIGLNPKQWGRAGAVIVVLPAAALVHRSLPAALAPRAPRADFSRPPLPGRRWLVCVDALDAVTDPGARAAVLSRLAGLTGADPWQVLVTTRQLPADELAALTRHGYTAYHLTPFDDEAFRRCAHAWTGSGAEAFTEWVSRRNLDALTRIPLFAGIAAQLWRREAVGEAAGPAELLDRFVQHLLPAGRAPLDEACEKLRARLPHGRDFADRLAGLHQPLVEVAATAVLAERNPVEAVVAWTARQAGVAPAELPADWPEHVRRILGATGLFTPEELAPVWRRVIEHLAAGPIARGDGDPAGDEPVTAQTRGVQSAALARVDPDRTRAQLADPAGVLAAGYWLVSGEVDDPELRADILAALLAGWTPPRADGECWSLLASYDTTAERRRELHAVATDPDRPSRVRRATTQFLALRRTS
ncbi:hypothetical protein GCM10023322_58850 [Rugosimonospora acidiphila]|uniref:NACHT domain-containing protein n=1 Tax=Rugosimonospora acidiphila TaxID=556531 RepID=A0ABP9SD56_9ACTN